MGFVLKALCPTSNYESEPLTVGDGEHIIALCNNCTSVVNPSRILFHFTQPTCPSCAAVISKSGFVDALQLPVYDDTETEHQCPRCQSGHLIFRTIMHVSYFVKERWPQEGTIIHGQLTDSSEVEIPGLYLIDGEVHLKDNSKYSPNKPFVAKVVQVIKKSSTLEQEPARRNQLAAKITLRFMRYLSEEELDSAD